MCETCRIKDSIVKELGSCYITSAMKKTTTKTRPGLKQKLAFVRTIVRELTPKDLEQVNGGNWTVADCYTECCPDYSL